MSEITLEVLKESIINNNIETLDLLAQILKDNSKDDITDLLKPIINKEADINQINSLLVENKFINLKWEILLENESNEVKSIDQIKILLKLQYINKTSIEVTDLNIILSETQFDELQGEIEKLSKYFN